jgi:hypothetical protein
LNADEEAWVIHRRLAQPKAVLLHQVSALRKSRRRTGAQGQDLRSRFSRKGASPVIVVRETPDGGIVVDAIVAVEVVERHIEDGLTPKAAALKAMQELSGPVIGIALVLSAVLVPTAFILGTPAGFTSSWPSPS